MPPPTQKRYSLSLRMQTALAILLFIYTLHNRQVLDIKKKLDFDKKFVRI